MEPKQCWAVRGDAAPVRLEFVFIGFIALYRLPLGVPARRERCPGLQGEEV